LQITKTVCAPNDRKDPRHRGEVVIDVGRTEARRFERARRLLSSSSMIVPAHRRFRAGILGSIALAVAAAPAVAHAQSSGDAPSSPDRERRDPSAYPIEIEPHFAFATGGVYRATSGFGAGLRVSIPFFRSLLQGVPNDIAITLGADLLRYGDCYYGAECGANYLMVPAGAQWSVFVGRRLSMFAEGGVFVFKGFFDGCSPKDGPSCSPPSDFGVLPMLAAGVRVHVGDDVSFTARLGYPTFTVGVSFL
jgi:hypothetical protein